MPKARRTELPAMHWAKVARKSPREYTLSAGDNVIARLIWQKAWGSHVIGESSHGSWSFKRVGFFATSVSIRPASSEQEIGSFYPGMFGNGRIELSDGRSWRLQPRGMFNAEYVLFDSSGQVTLSLKVQGWGKGAEVQPGPSVPDNATLSMLLLLVWHVVLLAIDDMSSAGAVVAAMG